ncbi:hypothetical protein K1719_011591 [Acacia pycnantha]|nr:hypothetical protein K1719_011591 [Acacia pycnantha]
MLEEVQNLVPGIRLQQGTTFFMAEAFNIHFQHYLQALFGARERIFYFWFWSLDRQLSFQKISVSRLLEFEGE